MQTTIDTVFDTLSTAYGITLQIYDSQGSLLERFSPRPGSDEFLFAISTCRERLFELCAQTEVPQIVSSEINQLWAGMSIQNEDGTRSVMVIGPVHTSEISKGLMVDYLRSSGFTARQRLRLSQALEATPICPYVDFTRLLSVIYALIHGDELDVARLSIVGLGEDEIASPSEVHYYQEDHAARDDAPGHDRDFERFLLECIREGSLAKLKRLLRTAVLDGVPIVSLSDPIRQQKDLFIIVTTLATRAAIEGGLNPDVALSISNLYIQRVELTNSVPAIMTLTRGMLYDYTFRVSNVRRTHRYSRSINDCCNYIDEHIREKIQVGDVAAFVGFNPRYLSRKFKQETGQTLGEYIRDAKVSEAKSLLKYSELSLSEISELLSFSSQSYFTYTFRQATGVTPGRYRETAERDRA